MAGFLYYFPVTGAGRHTFELRGLEHALDGPGIGERCGIDAGPDGTRGVVVAPPCPHGEAPSPRAGGQAGAVRWERIPGERAQGAWLGALVDDPPTPADLERRELLGGHVVEIGGGSWTVPVARMVDGTTPLPRSIVWGGEERGWARGDVLPIYRELFGHACVLWDALMGARERGETSLTLESNVAALALALNYRLGPPEISFLGLFTTRTELEVLKAVVDWPGLRELGGKAVAAEL